MILVDVMGYGLVVVICIIFIVIIVKVMVNKGKIIDEIFYEINCKLYIEILDDCFVVLLGIEICFYLFIVIIVNVGLLEVLCCCK